MILVLLRIGGGYRDHQQIAVQGGTVRHAQQRDIVSTAIKRLERKGLKADGHVLGTRDGAKKIVQEALKCNCEAIVMAADPDRNRVVGNLMWTQEPQRVRRRSKLPVFLVEAEARK